MSNLVFTKHTMRLAVGILVASVFFALLPIRSADAMTQAYTCADIQQIARPDCDVLQDLYDAGFGRNGETGKKWFTSRTPCLWGRGSSGSLGLIPSERPDWVRCAFTATSSRVSILNLRSNIGFLPPTIGNLSALVELEIYGNSRMTALPIEIGRLTNLEILDLENVENITTLPASIGNLTQLKQLKISFSPRFTTLPPQLFTLPNLEMLWLWQNRGLTTLPTALGNSQSLDILTLHDLGITSIPAEIGNLGNLGWLEIKQNQQLQTVPSTIGRLQRLARLTIVGNPQLKSLPAELARENFGNNIKYFVDVPVSAETTNPITGGNNGSNICPTSGKWPAGCTPSDQTGQTGGSGSTCVIPPSGPWPPCATGGATPPPTTGCVIPLSGPWPPCATQGATPPTISGCVIPPSGPWPACARDG